MLYPKSQTPAFPVHVSVEATWYLEEGAANRTESWACQRLVPRRQKRKRKQKVLTFDENLLVIVAREMLRFLGNPPSFRLRNSVNFRYQKGENCQV